MAKEKNNTAKPRSVAKLHKALAGLQEHYERHPRDSVTATRISNLQTKIKGGK